MLVSTPGPSGSSGRGLADLEYSGIRPRRPRRPPRPHLDDHAPEEKPLRTSFRPGYHGRRDRPPWCPWPPSARRLPRRWTTGSSPRYRPARPRGDHAGDLAARRRRVGAPPSRSSGCGSEPGGLHPRDRSSPRRSCPSAACPIAARTASSDSPCARPRARRERSRHPARDLLDEAAREIVGRDLTGTSRPRLPGSRNPPRSWRRAPGSEEQPGARRRHARRDAAPRSIARSDGKIETERQIAEAESRLVDLARRRAEEPAGGQADG